MANLLDRLFNHTFFDLIETGRLGFPFGLLNGRDDDVKGCCDFVGLNVYSRFHVAFNPRSAGTFFADVFVPLTFHRETRELTVLMAKPIRRRSVTQ